MEPTRSDRNPARILFLSRRYPPSMGGIQTHCFHLYTRLKEFCPVTLIALGMDSLLHLLWFLPYAWLRAFFALVFRRVDVVYFSDGVICCLAPLLYPFASSSCRFVVTIFGLEMTYGNRAAQALMRAGARRCERITVISENSRRLAVEWGLPADRIELIYVGVEPALPAEETCEALRLQFQMDYGLRFGSDQVLLNLGRQVPRKGMRAFIENGLVHLDPAIHLVIAGSGPEVPQLRRAIEEGDAASRVLLLGRVSDEMAAMLRQHADLFIMPNVETVGDVEGYGIAPLESMYVGTPVVAFDVDALGESIRSGGYLVDAGDYPAFAARVAEHLNLYSAQKTQMATAARDYVLREYNWELTARRYRALFDGRALDAYNEPEA